MFSVRAVMDALPRIGGQLIVAGICAGQGQARQLNGFTCADVLIHKLRVVGITQRITAQTVVSDRHRGALCAVIHLILRRERQIQYALGNAGVVLVGAV